MIAALVFSQNVKAVIITTSTARHSRAIHNPAKCPQSWQLSNVNGQGRNQIICRRAMEFGIRIGSLGNIRTTTLKAFTEEEIARVVDKLG